MEQVTSVESYDHSCLDQEAEAIPHDSLPTDEGSSDGNVSISGEKVTDGLAAPNGQQASLDLAPLSDSPHSDGTPPISDHSPEGDSLWVWSWQRNLHI